MSAHPTAGSDCGTVARASGQPAHRADRLTGIDAARGIAMLLVFLSHVRFHFVDSAPALHTLLTFITRLATPTFLLLSGFIAAYVLSSGRNNARITLFDRGLFVLLAGHLLLNLEELRSVSLEQWLLGRVTVTDAIAVCLMSATVLGRLPIWMLAMLGAALALASWPIAMMWTPESQASVYAASVLFNVQSEANALTDAALVPYLGVFVLGMSLSKWTSSLIQRRDFAHLARRMLIVGSSAIGLVLLGVIGWFASKNALLQQFGESEMLDLLRRTLDPRSKMPPSPAYLLQYGGGGLLIAAACLAARPAFLMRPIVAWSATLGRASLMCFVVQDWLFTLAPAVFDFETITSVAFWSAYFVAGAAVVHWTASRWDAARANRFLTVGLKRLA